MPDAREQIERFTIICKRCDRPVIARVEWVAWEVQCPHCQSLLRVPDVPDDGRPVPADIPHMAAKHGFNFPCPRCGCLLEAHTGMCGRNGTCPTCNARLNIPHLRPKSGKPLKAELLDDEGGDPTPVHAYGASGHSAPQIINCPDGSLVIQCPRCNAHSPIDADTCEACGIPFTMDAAATVGKMYRDRWAASSVTLGVVGVVVSPLFIPGFFATWYGLRSVMFSGHGRRKYLGLLGMLLGLISLGGGIVSWYWMLK